MQIARETDLLELLTHFGYQVKRIGRYYTTAEMDSLRIKDRRTWFRYSQNTGGDAITLVQQFCDKPFPEAVEYLLVFNGRARDFPAKAATPVKQIDSPKPFALPPRNADDRRVFAYLRKRGIAAHVIRQFMNSGLLYEDAEHHNCVFVGKDHTVQAKYAGLRGIYDREGKGFRGDVTGSDKRVDFALPYDRSSDQVFVFEAPIDLMSYLTLHRNTPNALALCGLYAGALQAYSNSDAKAFAILLKSKKPLPVPVIAQAIAKMVMRVKAILITFRMTPIFMQSRSFIKFRFVCLLSGSFQMDRAAFAYIIRCPCRCSGNGGSKRRSRPNSVFVTQSFPMQS